MHQIGFASALFGKYRQGKNIFKGDFTAKDWKDVGVESLKGGAIGAVIGSIAGKVLSSCLGDKVRAARAHREAHADRARPARRQLAQEGRGRRVRRRLDAVLS